MTNKFSNAVTKTSNVAYGANGMKAKKSTMNAALDLYAAMGALRGRPEKYMELFEKAMREDMTIALQLLFMTRDVRNGKGERDLFRHALQTLELKQPMLLLKVLHLVPKYGRWDDLLVFKTSAVQKAVVKILAKGLNNKETASLVAKWLPRKPKNAIEKSILSKLRSYIHKNPADFRKKLVTLSNVVEQKMCANEWTEINYSHVPSKASTIYRNAFQRHDEAGYAQYAQDLSTGKAKINASAVYPYEIINHKVINKEMSPEECIVLDTMWNSMPNFFGDKTLNVLPVIDVSSSMYTYKIANSTLTCKDIAMTLGMYVSERANNDFKNLYITFAENPLLNKLDGSDVVTRFTNLSKDNTWGGSTDLEKTYHLIGSFAKQHKMKQEDMPEYLLIISDMNFNKAVDKRFEDNLEVANSAHKMGKQIMESYGYELPTIVFWNVNHNDTFVAKGDKKGVMMISGYSPSVLQDIMDGLAKGHLDITPTEVMLAAVERYKDVEDALHSKSAAPKGKGKPNGKPNSYKGKPNGKKPFKKTLNKQS